MVEHVLAIGPEHPLAWWEEQERQHRGFCDDCVFGGPEQGAYWMYADDCPLWHGEDSSQ